MIFMPVCILAIRDEDDRQFMERLYVEHWRMMFRSAWRVLRDRDASEDAVNGACVSLIRNIDRLRSLDEKVLPAYIMVTVRNQARMHLRRSETEQRALERLSQQQALEMDEENVEKIVFRNCSLERMKLAIRQLPEIDQEILRMKYFDWVKDEEAVKILGMCGATLRSRRMRALKKLYRLLEGRENGEE